MYLVEASDRVTWDEFAQHCYARDDRPLPDPWTAWSALDPRDRVSSEPQGDVLLHERHL